MRQQPKPFRQRASLSAEELAAHDAMCARVSWEPLVSFDRPAAELPTDPREVEKLSPAELARIESDHGTLPYEPGLSLMDRERRGYLRVLYAAQWSGGIQIEASDEEHHLRLMLDRQQALMLLTALWRWRQGTVRDWIRQLPKAVVRCRRCKGSGIIAIRDDQEYALRR